MFLRGLRRIQVGPRWYSIQNLEVFGIHEIQLSFWYWYKNFRLWRAELRGIDRI